MKEQYKIIIAGDLLPSANNLKHFESGNVESLFDEKLLALFRDADFSLVNLEGPLTNATIKQNKVGPLLKTSTKTANGIKTLGVKCVALANNHFTDYLQQGCEETLKTLDEVGIDYLGGGLNKKNIKNYISIELGNTRVCIYNVSERFFNIADDIHAGVNVYDEYLVCNEIKELKSRHDYLIVVYHGGAELCSYPAPSTRLRFRRMADSGADFITAQHTHRIGCEEHYHNSLLLYGQGNFFMEHMTHPDSRQGLVTQVVFNEDNVVVKHHLVRISSGRLVYDEQQDFEKFDRRTDEIKDELVAIKRYEEFVRNNNDLKNKYFQAYKGGFWGKKVLERLSRRFLLQYIENSYSEQQLSRILFSLESDRMREDIGCLWRQLKKRKYE